MQHIKTLILENEAGLAAKKLLEHLESTNMESPKIKTQLMLQMQRLNALEEDESMGMLTREQARAEKNSILKGLLAIVNKLDDNTSTAPPARTPTPKPATGSAAPPAATTPVAPAAPQKPLNVFTAYAHNDEALRDELHKQLIALEQVGLIKVWYDREILPGQEWDHVIHNNLATADVILLLISADFIASDYCTNIEMKTALARHANGEATVIPIILRKCMWHLGPLGNLQALPKNAEPVTSDKWDTIDDAFNNVAEGIAKLCQQ